MRAQADYEAQTVQEVREVSLAWGSVESSNIDLVGYNTAESVLGIKFNSGAVYYYYNVPQEVYVDLIAAESVGKAFHTTIKGKYEYAKFSD